MCEDYEKCIYLWPEISARISGKQQEFLHNELFHTFLSIIEKILTYSIRQWRLIMFHTHLFPCVRVYMFYSHESGELCAHKVFKTPSNVFNWRNLIDIHSYGCVHTLQKVIKYSLTNFLNTSTAKILRAHCTLLSESRHFS